MTDDDVVRLAERAGFIVSSRRDEVFRRQFNFVVQSFHPNCMKELVRFAELAVAEERDAILNLADVQGRIQAERIKARRNR